MGKAQAWRELVMVLDQAGIVLFAGTEPASAAERTAGWVGRPVGDLFVAADRPRLAQTMAELSGLPTEMVLSLAGDGAAPVPQRACLSPLPGALNHWTLVCRPADEQGVWPSRRVPFAAPSGLYDLDARPDAATSQPRNPLLLRDLAGDDVLRAMASELAGIAGSCVSMFEADGNYAAGCHGSAWCRWLDETSFGMAGGELDAAMSSGRWVCHECRWHDAVKPVLTTGRAVEMVCAGGVQVLAVPVLTSRGVVGVICGSVADPPAEAGALNLVAERYGLDPGQVAQAAEDHHRQPSYLYSLVSERLRATAGILGLLVERGLEQQRLAAAERKLAAAFRNVPDALVITTIDEGVVVDCSDSFGAVSGYARSEAIGKRTIDLGLWASPGQRDQVVADLRTQGRVVGREVDFRLADGRVCRSVSNFEVVNLDGTMCVLTVVRMIDSTI